MRNALLLIVGIIVLLVVAWYGSRALGGVFTASRNITPVPTAILTATPSAAMTPNPVSVNAQPQSQSQNITVSTPAPNSTVRSPFVVGGSARVFESVVSIELTDNSGNVLYSGNAFTNAPDAGLFGQFQQQIQFVTNATSGVLTVYQASPRDGSRVDVVEVPLVFN